MTRATGKKLRFEVFKRDGFKCCYCGRTPPAVVLECDHVIPVADGGKSTIENLVAACFGCNRGKGKVSLESIPPSMVETMEAAKEKEAQIRQFRKFTDKIEKRLSADAESINEIYNAQFGGWWLKDSFIKSSVYLFLKALPFHEVNDAMSIASSKMYYDKDRAIKYFCGICWKKIRDQGGDNA